MFGTRNVPYFWLDNGAAHGCSFTGSSQSHAASRKEFDDRVSADYATFMGQPYAEKLEPQPQEPVALGFSILKPDSERLST